MLMALVKEQPESTRKLTPMLLLLLYVEISMNRVLLVQENLLLVSRSAKAIGDGVQGSGRTGVFILSFRHWSV